MNEVAIVPRKATRSADIRGNVPKLGVLEWFLLIQLLSSGLTLLPGAAPFRIVARALPYVSSLAIFGWSLANARSTLKRPSGHTCLLVSLVIIGVSAFIHPNSVPAAGIAQFIYQLSIAAPLFWVRRYPVSLARLEKLIWILFLCSAISSAFGALQIYRPDRFMPKNFSSGLEDDYISSMSYEGTNGNMIMRPPGLTDLPGGAATAAVITAFLGLVLMTRSGAKFSERLLCGPLTLIGLLVLYLTQVRSYFLDLVVVILMVMSLRLIKKQLFAGLQLIATAAFLVFAAFIWAESVGGEQISERFTGLADQGIMGSYQQNRGSFIAETFQEDLPRFPLGAGVGRWGIISQYFGQNSTIPPLYAEIQMTGWIFDGGLPLLIIYPTAILIALYGEFRIARCARTIRWNFVAQVILCVNLLIAIQALAGPTFNTQLGTLFWFLAAVLDQASANGSRLMQPVRKLAFHPSLSHPQCMLQSHRFEIPVDKSTAGNSNSLSVGAYAISRRNWSKGTSIRIVDSRARTSFQLSGLFRVSPRP